MILIDANRADEEFWRLERLDLLRRILRYHEHTFLEAKATVIGLYDHKGMLAVNWSARPSKDQRERLGIFWGEVFCEPEIEHFVRGRSMLDEVHTAWSDAPFPVE